MSLSTALLWFLVCFFVGTMLLLFRRRSPNTGRRVGRTRKPIEEVLKHPEDISYDIKELPSPTVVGWKLRLLARLQHSTFGMSVVMPFLNRRSNMDLLSGEYIPERATFSVGAMTVPDRPASAVGNNRAIESLVKAHRNNEFVRSTSVDYYNAYNAGECDPLDVAKFIIQSIDDSNASHPPLRAIIKFDRHEILRMAKASSDRWKNGKPLSYLDGVPVSFKETFKVDPYDCNGGACFPLTSTRDRKESVLVSRMKEAGAIVIGLANLQEAGAGTFGSNPNKKFQTARNPYNINHYCGGSSSGSGCSVAAGLCTVSLGSDAGGSIRIPAAYCGVVGLKPTFGLVETTGFTNSSETVGVLGPLTASVLDAAIAMDVLCPDKSKFDLTDIQKESLDGIKIGVYWEYFQHANKEIVDACKLAVEKMVSLGGECVDIKIPELEEVRVAHAMTTASEFGLGLAPDIDNNFEKLTVETLALVGMGYTVSAKDYINFQRQRTRSIHTLEMLFDEVDVIVTPSVATLAPPIPKGAEEYGIMSLKTTFRSMRFVSLANFTGIPGIAIPVGTSKSGLPISLQIMGPWFEEGRLLHIAGVLERETAHLMEKPSVYYDILGNARH